MAASRVKSVSFKEDEKKLLEHCENKGNFSEYVKKLIKADMLKGNRLFSKEQEQAIIDLIKRYAPTVTEEDIKSDFDEDAVDALEQFDDM